MSLMPTLLIGIRRVSGWPCTSSTLETRGFWLGTATFIGSSFLASDQAQDGACPAECNDIRGRPAADAAASVTRYGVSDRLLAFGFVGVEIADLEAAGLFEQNLDFLLRFFERGL